MSFLKLFQCAHIVYWYLFNVTSYSFFMALLFWRVKSCCLVECHIVWICLIVFLRCYSTDFSISCVSKKIGVKFKKLIRFWWNPTWCGHFRGNMPSRSTLGQADLLLAMLYYHLFRGGVIVHFHFSVTFFCFYPFSFWRRDLLSWMMAPWA